MGWLREEVREGGGWKPVPGPVLLEICFVIHTGLGEHLEMGHRDLKVKPSPSSQEPLVTVIFPRIQQSKRDSGENPHDTPWAFGLIVIKGGLFTSNQKKEGCFSFPFAGTWWGRLRVGVQWRMSCQALDLELVPSCLLLGTGWWGTAAGG